MEHRLSYRRGEDGVAEETSFLVTLEGIPAHPDGIAPVRVVYAQERVATFSWNTRPSAVESAN